MCGVTILSLHTCKAVYINLMLIKNQTVWARVSIYCAVVLRRAVRCRCTDQPPTQTRGLKRKFSEKVPLVLLKDFISKFLGKKSHRRIF